MKDRSAACGHRARTFDGAPLVCELAKGHKGLHQESVKLRDCVERTHWQDDGRGVHGR